jgi:hypothetical protein
VASNPSDVNLVYIGRMAYLWVDVDNVDIAVEVEEDGKQADG